MIVIDSSIAACWALPDEFSEVANMALDLIQVGGSLVPPIFWYEIRNVLVVNERRKRIDKAASDQAMGHISGLPIEVDDLAGLNGAMALARRRSLTIYDASYLELAIRLNASLATLDKQLAAAARLEGVSVMS